MRIGSLIGDFCERMPILGRFARKLRPTAFNADDTAPTVNATRQQLAYAKWIDTCEHNLPGDSAIPDTSLANTPGPIVTFLIPILADSVSSLETTLKSLHDQSNGNWEVCVAVAIEQCRTEPIMSELSLLQSRDHRLTFEFTETQNNRGEALNLALSGARGTLAAVIDPADVLLPETTAWLVNALSRHPECDVVYTDEDWIDENNSRIHPYFKSDFNALLLLTQGYLGRLTAYRRTLLEHVGGFRCDLVGAEEYDLSLRCFAATERNKIVHLPKVLYHRRSGSGHPGHLISCDSRASSMRLAANDYLRSQQIDATIEPSPTNPHFLQIQYGLPATLPLVSLIICTRNNETLLRSAVESIVQKTIYTNYEIIIVDNGSTRPITRRYLREIGIHGNITVIRHDAPFNYSQLNNLAIQRAAGELLCLLNDDIEVVTPGWLEEMLMFGLRPEVGAVGARLWYPDGTLQHGGVILGIGPVAAHAHTRLPKGEPGYFGRAILQQEVSAVIAACPLLKRDVFHAVGGLDEALPADFNDVDLCLRIRQAGYSIIWTPYAELVHHESASRGQPDTAAKRRRLKAGIKFMKDRWCATLRIDPYYNPNLSDRTTNFTIRRCT